MSGVHSLSCRHHKESALKGRSSYRVAWRVGSSLYRVTRIVYGSDSSYYLIAPTHPSQRALFAKFTVNYAKQELLVAFKDFVDVAAAAAPDKEIKLTHHRDGFVQFSGAGILSGRAEDGTIRGMGIESWPLWQPVRGPTCGLVAVQPEALFAPITDNEESVIFDDAEMAPLKEWNELILEAHYFPYLCDASSASILLALQQSPSYTQLRQC